MKVISTDQAPAAIGPYSQAIEANGMLFASGQIPVNPATGEVVSGDVKAQAEQVCRNIGEVLKAAGYSFDQVVKTTCFLADMADFAAFNEASSAIIWDLAFGFFRGSSVDSLYSA